MESIAVKSTHLYIGHVTHWRQLERLIHVFSRGVRVFRDSVVM